MKKTRIRWEWIFEEHSLKILKLMRNALILIFLTAFQVFADDSYSQKTKMSLQMNDVTVEKVLNEIEDQSEFYFLCNKKLVDVDRKVNIQFEDQDINHILAQLFDGTNVEYIVIDRQIVLSPGKYLEEARTKLQPRTISGTITDLDGEPLPGVGIAIKGTTRGTITNLEGEYTIEVGDPSAILIFSYVGYLTQELAVGDQTEINVQLESDIYGLEEVVVIGYGTKRKINLTGSVSSVKSEELVKRPSYSVGSLIQGRVPGLQIIQQSGEPGNEKLKIAIRGKGTFSSAGSNPLVVIDGVSYPSWTALENLDPDNIETIDILKDAASASIYGARAANGVILVTTKKGVSAKPKISYNGSTGFQTATFIPDFVDNSVEYMEMYNYTVERQGTGTPFADTLIEAYRNAAPGDPQYPNYDWRDALFNPGWGQKHSLSATGGNEITQFYAGVGYYDQDAIMRGQSYNRYNAQFNLDTKITDWMTFGTNINALVGKKLGPAMTSTTLMMFAYDMNPTTSPRLPDGRWSAGAVSPPYYVTNNIWRLTETEGEGGTRLNENYAVTASGLLNINITPALLLNITGSFSYDANFEMVHQINPPDDREYYFQTGEFARVYYNYNPGLSNSTNRSVMPSFHSTLNYSKTFSESHNLMALVGYNQEYYKIRSLYGHRRDYAFNNLPEINAGDPSVQTLTGTSSEWAIQSFFGRITYDYEGKYLFEANARYDGTSRIHKDNRWGLFPSFSAGWRASEENFLNTSDWIDNLKLRASWGQLGNQNIGNYPYQSLLTTTNYAQGEGIEQGVLLTNLSDPTLKWEVTTITNVGIDLDLRRGLFSLVFDLYNKDTEGILNQATIPASVGLSPPYINYGSMNNRGFEFLIGHRHMINELSYSVNFNFSRNRNEITKLISPSYGLQSNQVGHEFGAHYMVEWIGIFQSQGEIDAAPLHPFNPKPGDLRFKDQNGDNVINADDRVIIPGRYPKFLYGGNINMDWRNWDLSLFIQGVAGTRHYITRRGEWPFLRMAPPTKEWRNAWTPDNPTNDMPALYQWPYAPIWSTPNSYFLKYTSYVRLKNIQLGYTLPENVTGKIGLQELRIYVSADNLFTYAPWTTSDPERDEDVHYGYQTEAASYPNVKTFTFGIRINL